MPSEERTALALDALRGATRSFLASLDLTADEVRSFLAVQQSTIEGRVARLAAELGPFATGRVDARRLAAVFDHEQRADPLTLDTVRRALDTLTELAARKEELFVVGVPEGGSLRDAVAGTLALVGRTFAAARVVQGARVGQARPVGDPGALDGLPFSRWTRAERRLAPPLVVEVAGSDLRAAGLAEFLDGRQKLVLVVKGECAPAPLVRLVAPGTFVLQSDDGAGLDRLAAWEGPGVAALVPPSAARFRHDPAAGTTPWDRLTVGQMPDKPPRRAIGGLSVAQQLEELELLRGLASRPAVAGAGGQVDPVDKLAAWVLSQADLSDVG